MPNSHHCALLQIIEPTSSLIGPADAFRKDVNVATIELPHSAISPAGLRRAGAASLPGLSAQKLAGFLSLLNGLLDQSGTATRDVAPARPFQRPGAKLLPGATTTGKTERRGDITDAGLRAALLQTMPPATIAESRVLIQSSEIQGGGLAGESHPTPSNGEALVSSARTQPQPLVLGSFGATSTSLTSSQNDYPPSAAHDVAFALRLTWEPASTHADPMPAAMMNTPPRPPSLSSDSGSRNPTISAAATRASPSPALSEITPRPDSTGATKAQILPEIAKAGSAVSELAHSSSSLQSIPAPSPGTPSPAAGGAGPRSETSVPIRPANVHSGTAPSLEASAKTSEIDAQLTGVSTSMAPAATAEPPAMEPAPVSSSQEVRRQEDLDTPAGSTPETSVRLEASTPPNPGLEEAGADLAAPPRARVVGSGSLPATQETRPENPGKTMDDDSVDSESDRKGSRIQPNDKIPQIQNAGQPGDRAVAGVWLERGALPGGAAHTSTQNQTELSAAARPSSTASPELETTSAVPPQPLREISFRLAADSANVDVQVAARFGRIQVAVRTADPDLAKSLQSNLGELTGRLEDKGFRTESWTPITPQSAAVRELSSSANSQSQSDDSHGRGGQQGQRQGQQESNQRQPGRWKNEYEETVSAPSAWTYEGEKS